MQRAAHKSPGTQPAMRRAATETPPLAAEYTIKEAVGGISWPTGAVAMFTPDDDEPYRLAQAVKALKLRYAVITSPDRDDLKDGGAKHFAAVISELRKAVEGRQLPYLPFLLFFLPILLP